MTESDRPQKTPSPKKFYQRASVDQCGKVYTLELDGRRAKTREGHVLSTPSHSLASAIEDEWNAQDQTIEFGTMPMTGYLMTLLDATSADHQGWREEILRFLGSDLLCYRAEVPKGLVARQAAIWDPLLGQLTKRTQISLVSTPGIVFVTQPETSLQKADSVIDKLEDADLLCVRRITELTGSAVLGLLGQMGSITPTDIVAAAQLDEVYQAEQWGTDAQAEERRQSIAKEIQQASQFLALHNDQ